MNERFTPTSIDLKTGLKVVQHRLNKKVKRHWFKVSFLACLAYVVYRKDLSIDLYLNGVQNEMVASVEAPVEIPQDRMETNAMNVSLVEKEAPVPVAEKKEKTRENWGNTYSNMTYTEEKFATKDSRTAQEIKRQKQQAYVNRFAKAAQAEMQRYGIPASVILAQGLIESDAGESRLALENNNHFGIKCFSRTCRKGHCSNYTDDSHKDFFRIYKSTWESYRAHSHLLQADRYRNLYKLDKKDYKGWAMGLKKAGYATDKYYGEKLINLIEDLNLQKYDR